MACGFRKVIPWSAGSKGETAWQKGMVEGVTSKQGEKGGAGDSTAAGEVVPPVADFCLLIVPLSMNSSVD